MYRTEIHKGCVSCKCYLTRVQVDQSSTPSSNFKGPLCETVSKQSKLEPGHASKSHLFWLPMFLMQFYVVSSILISLQVAIVEKLDQTTIEGQKCLHDTYLWFSANCTVLSCCMPYLASTIGVLRISVRRRFGRRAKHRAAVLKWQHFGAIWSLDWYILYLLMNDARQVSVKFNRVKLASLINLCLHVQVSKSLKCWRLFLWVFARSPQLPSHYYCFPGNLEAA